jgi:O-antigen/teichoic acid export membrane protein
VFQTDHFKRFFFYGIGVLGARLINFAIFPFFTFYLSTEELGLYDLILTISFIYISIASLQLGDAAYRYILKYEDIPINTIISTVYFFLFISSLVSTSITLIINLFYPIEHYYLIVAILLSSLFLNVIRQIVRGLGDVKLFAISGVSYSFSFLIFNLVFLILYDFKLEGVLFAFLFSNIISVVSVLTLKKQVASFQLSCIDLNSLKKLLTFSFPLVPNHISWWLINAANRFVLLYYVGVETVGLYAVAAKFAAVMLVFNSLFAMVWQDKVLIDNQTNKYSTELKIYIYFQLAIVVLFMFFTPFVYDEYIGTNFSESQNYVPILLIAAFLSSISSFYGAVLIKLKDTSAIFKSSLTAGFISVVAAILLIQYIGVMGAAIAECIGFFIMTFIRFFRLKNDIKLDLLQLIIVISLLTFSIYLTSTDSIWTL